jgi:5-methylcytosine-specific restriction endonuclease McrA
MCIKTIDVLRSTDPEYIEHVVKNAYTKLSEDIIGHTETKTLNKSQCNRIKDKYNNKCAVCDFSINDLLEVHHIIPKSAWGKNDDSNLIVLCPTCHSIFHDIEQKKCIAPEIRNYLHSRNFLSVFEELTEHLTFEY